MTAQCSVFIFYYFKFKLFFSDNKLPDLIYTRNIFLYALVGKSCNNTILVVYLIYGEFLK